MTRRIRCLTGSKQLDSRLVINGREVIDDLSRLWSGCYVNHDDVNYYIEGVRAYKETPVFMLYNIDEDADRRIISFDHPALHKDYPELGYFNITGGNAIYFNKHIGRQWKRGVHDVNISTTLPYESLLKHRSRYNVSRLLGIPNNAYGGHRTYVSLANLFTPQYSTYRDALVSIRNNKSLSVALNREIALAVHPANGEIQVFYHELLVGVVDSEDGIGIRREFNWLTDTIMEVTSS